MKRINPPKVVFVKSGDTDINIAEYAVAMEYPYSYHAKTEQPCEHVFEITVTLACINKSLTVVVEHLGAELNRVSIFEV